LDESTLLKDDFANLEILMSGLLRLFGQLSELDQRNAVGGKDGNRVMGRLLKCLERNCKNGRHMRKIMQDEIDKITQRLRMEAWTNHGVATKVELPDEDLILGIAVKELSEQYTQSVDRNTKDEEASSVKSDEYLKGNRNKYNKRKQDRPQQVHAASVSSISTETKSGENKGIPIAQTLMTNNINTTYPIPTQGPFINNQYGPPSSNNSITSQSTNGQSNTGYNSNNCWLCGGLHKTDMCPYCNVGDEGAPGQLNYHRLIEAAFDNADSDRAFNEITARLRSINEFMIRPGQANNQYKERKYSQRVGWMTQLYERRKQARKATNNTTKKT
jgi:hypothetical protein